MCHFVANSLENSVRNWLQASRMRVACLPRTCSGSTRATVVCATEARSTVTADVAGSRLILEHVARKAAAAVAAGMLCTCPASLAELQAVAPQDVTSLARSLPKQTVNKGKVWLIFLAGATGLFGAAVAIERNSALFPAIAKANQAMAASRSKQKAGEKMQAAIEVESSSEPGSEEAVLQGLADARSKTLAESSSSNSSGGSMDNEGREGLAAVNGRGGAQSDATEEPRKAENSEARDKIVEQSSSGS